MKEIENLIHQFDSDHLHSLLRAKTRTFRLLDEQLPHLNDDQFSDCNLFGEFKVNNDDLMVVVTAKVNKPLSERSGKKAQYTLGKKFFRDSRRYIGGFFVFYDDEGDFRFSLIYDIPRSTGKRDWSDFRRYTYFVSKDQTNKTFIKQFTEADFTSLDKIIDAFSVEKVTKQFYQEIANWYFWALKNVKFPDDAEAEKNGKEISVIRLITRLIFIWFMKVRKLVPNELFDEDIIKEILTDLKQENDNYYKAILQNLFFATLNTKPEERRFTSKKKGYKGFSQDFGNHNVYRYEELFKDSEEVIEKYFMPIPFLNGGLFECLDYKSKIKDERKYIDGFTSTKSQQPIVPNFLFFSDEKLANELNKDYGTTNKKYLVRGIINTLSLYNFTIDESDPNDADVALDPELLGKVFENLLASYNPETAKTARKSTGSYYTPRPIVDYMVDESLKQYFKTHLQIDDIENKLNILFSSEEQENPFDDATTKKLVELIDSLRVVDPAVGSGAFPMRILNRLVFLLHKLDPDNSLWKQSQIEGIKKSVKDPILQRKLIEETERKFKEKNPDYGRKLYLIEKCIYGVDIQQIAVEIAKLRFFISLLVDEKVEDGEIEPLPNLDFKLMQGNSLISSFAGIDFTTKPNNDDALFDFDEQYKKLIDEFEELKSQYQNEPDVHKKRDLRDKIDAKLLEIFEEKLRQHYPQLNELESKYGKQKEILETEKKKLFKKIGIDLEQAEQDLIAYTEGRKPKDFFLWDVYFAEVFAEKNGFDIVIGNPPYVDSENMSHFQPLLREKIKEIYFATKGNWDLFIPFIEKGIHLLNDKGCECYIVPNKLIAANYSVSLKEFLLNFSIIEISDYSRIPVFKEQDIYPITFLISKEPSTNKQVKVRIMIGLNEILALNVIDREVFYKDIFWDKFFFNTNIVNLISKLTKNPRLIDFDIEVLGSATVNEAYEIKKCLTDDYKADGYILVNTGTIDRYQILWGKTSTQYIKDQYMYPKISKSKLKKINPTRAHQASSSKIIISGMSKEIEAVYDDGRCVAGKSTVIILGDENILKPILGIINSRLISFYVFHYFHSLKMSGGYLNIGTEIIKNIPIPKLSEKVKKFLSNKVEEVLIHSENDTTKIFNITFQIDLLVYKLYNLTYEEVKIIDPAFALTEKEYENFKIE